MKALKFRTAEIVLTAIQGFSGGNSLVQQLEGQRQRAALSFAGSLNINRESLTIAHVPM